MRSKVLRSRLLAGGAAVLGTLGVARATVRGAQFEYKLASPDPVDLPTTVAMTQLCEAVTAETHGRLVMKIFPNSVLGSQTALIGQLRLGSVQFLSSQHSSFAAIVPAAQIASVGFAFNSDAGPLKALDGALGAYIRKEFLTRGVHVFEKTQVTGFRHVTSSLKPIRTVDDLAGFKLRVLPAAIFVDLFKTLGAAPVPLDVNEMYMGLQTHVVDGEENAIAPIESFRLYEVQKYLSVTNHIWSGIWLAANVDAWNALPPDLRGVVNRNAEKFALRQRRDQTLLIASLSDKLRRQGMIFNQADAAGMRARLGPYYARWKNEFGTTAWSLLEDSVGKLG